MLQFKKLYEENKKLDELFEAHYNFSKKPELIRMNILAMLVELGELANETRVFKYWSIKGPSPREDILEELADCFVMIFSFCGILGVELDEEFPEVEKRKTVEQFLYLYNEYASFSDNYTKEKIKNILSNTIYLGHLLGFKNEDIIEGTLKKIDKDRKRFEIEY